MKIKELKLDKWTEIILDISDNNNTIANKIQQRTGCTFSYIVNIMQLLEKNKYITRTVEGRNKTIVITTKGKVMADHLNMIKNIMNEKVKR